MTRKIITYLLRLLLLAAVLCAGLVVWVLVETQPYILMSAQEAHTTQVAIVLGASIVGTSTLSQILKDRADEALVLYGLHKVGKILVTGDNSALSHDEVDPVGRYLEARGVPAQDIFLDHAGFDTYSSMYRAKVVFGVTSAAIVSQSFHLPRAVFLARELGIDAYGVPAQGGGFANYAREVPALVKALWDLAVQRVPQYLGPTVPITGTGTSTQPALSR